MLLHLIALCHEAYNIISFMKLLQHKNMHAFHPKALCLTRHNIYTVDGERVTTCLLLSGLGLVGVDSENGTSMAQN